MTGGASAIGLDTEERQDLYDDIIKEFKNRDTHKTFVDIIKDFGKDRLEKMNAAEIQERIESTIGDEYNMFSNYLVQNFSGQDTAGMLDLAHGEDKMNYKNYIKDAIKIQDWDDKLISTDKDYWNKKLTEQFKRDGYDINKIPGYFFKSNSEPSQRLKNNNDLKNMLKRHKYEILKGTDFSDGFPQYGNDLISKMQKGNNFKNAFGKVDFKHPYIDRHGNLHVIMCDTYDFNNEDNILIQAGRNQMKKGNIKPFFTIHEIIISKNEADKILR